MSTPTLLRDDLWEKLLELLRYQPNIYIGNEAQCRRFIEAVLWIDRTGAQWRLLPIRYGNWNSMFKRFDRWSRRGIRQQLYERVLDEPDLENLLMDSTIFCAHACAAGAKGGRQLKR